MPLPVVEVTFDFLYDGTVVRVIDGDTFEAVLSRSVRIDWGFHDLETIAHDRLWRFRLNGCNAPEVHGASKPAGLVAKQFAIDRLMGRPVVVRSIKTDDFGRWLANVTADGKDFTAEMIAAGQAVPYMVGK